MVDKIIVPVEIDCVDQIVRRWIKVHINWSKEALMNPITHEEDVRAYKKDIKAFKRILDYIGDDE